MDTKRFAVLLHQKDSERHYDLLIETYEYLDAWRLEKYPPAEEEWVSARRNFPHRKIYLEFEGVLSGNRGEVSRIDGGTCKEIEPGIYHFEGKKILGLVEFRQNPETKIDAIRFTS